MFKLGRSGQLKLMPKWLRQKIEVNRIATHELLKQAQSEISDGSMLLDAGSGEGQFSNYFSHTKYVGVDLAVGDLTWDYTGLDAVGDMRFLPFVEDSFDAAVCIQTMEHIDEPFQVTKEIARILKPGGRYYVSAPQSWHQHQKPHDFFRYTSFGFRHLLESSGLEVVDIRPWGGYFWFLSFNLQILHTVLFPPTRKRWVRFATLPLELIVQLIFFVLLPIPLYYLDALDHDKDYTLGWVCVAQKPLDANVNE